MIKNNVFDGMGMASIFISNDAQDWRESGAVKDVTIEGNTFYRPNAGAAAILIGPTNPTVSTDATVHENINIKNNNFYLLNGQALDAKSVKGISFTGNKIYRYDPNVVVDFVGSVPTTLDVEETASLSAHASGNSHDSNLYSFNGCKDVVISGNTYDGGLKLGGSKNNMEDSDIITNEDGIAIGGNATQLPAVGSIAYESSDEKVLTVNSRGLLTALKAGTAKVRAYTVTGGRKFVSDWHSITVGSQEEDVQTLSVSTGDTSVKDSRTTQVHDKQIQYKVTDANGNPVTGVTWLVQNAANHQETTCAEIDQTGKLTTKSDGVVGIVARKDGLEAREVLVINKGSKVLSNAVAIYNNDSNQYGEDATKWSITADGSIHVKAQSDGLWATQKTKNIFMTAENFSKDEDTTAIIKMSGQTQANYDEAGLLIGYDPDNYVFIGRKHGAGDKRIKMVKEISGSAEEKGDGQSDSEDLYLKLVKSRNNITGYYSNNGTDWTESGVYSFGDRIEQDVKVGFYAASGSNSGTPFEFSDLSVTTGSGSSAVTKPIPLTMDNQAPTVTGVSCAYANGALSMNTGTFSDANEGDTKGEFVLKWMASAEQNGIYELVPSLAHQQNPKVPAPLAGKWVKAVVIPQDSHGLYGTPVYSGPVQVGSDAAVQPTSISISADKRATTEYEEEISYTASILPVGAPTVVDWSVVDAVTKGTTSSAQIDENGQLTTKSNGVVEVVARTAGGLEARELLVINKDERALSHEIKIENEEQGKWNLPNDGVVSMQTTVGGLWEGKTVANMFSHTLSNAQNVTATIKMKGRTRYGYEEAGLAFYIDQNKYVFVGRKHAGGDNNRKIRLVTWTGTGKADETQCYPDQVNNDPVYLKLEKEGNTFKAFWSADKQTWNDVGTITNESLGQQFKVGFYAGKDEGSQSSATFKFSELEIDGTKIPLTAMNHAPAASNVTCNYDDTAKAVNADYKFADTDQDDTEGESIIRWMASDTDKGTYKLVEDESELVGKYAKAIIIPQDSNGLYGAPVVSAAAVYVGEMEEEEIPSSAESGLQSASIMGAGDFGTFQSSKTSYLTTAGKAQKQVTAAFAAKDDAAKLEVSLNGKIYTTSGTGSSVSNLALPLLSGINVIHATVTAEDQKTKTEYRFVILRTGDSDSKATAIQLNSTPFKDFDADTVEYEYTTDQDAKNLTVSVTAASEQASVKIAANGKLIEGNTISLEAGRNDVDIYITPETKYPQSRYQIAVFVPSETNANLKTLQFGSGVILKHPFDTRTTSYTGTVTAQSTELSVTADETNAKIEMTANGAELGSGTGSLEKTVPFTKGSNRIQVKVTSPDQNKTKTYMLKLVGVEEVALSSLQYNSNSAVGYGTIHKNESTDGNPITLLGEDGEIKTYESGIGGHADMNLYYNIDPSYIKFVSWIGVDQEKGNIADAASIKCSIYLDGSTTAAWSSGDTIMGKTTPAKKAEVDLGSAKVIRIFADQANGSNSNDHVSLGDAKFLTTLSDSSVGTFYDVEYRVEPEDAATITAAAGANANASNGDGYIRVSAGSEVTLTAAKAETAAADLVFAGWYDETGKRLSKELSYKVSNLQADTVCIAKLKTQAQIDLENACEALESVIEKLEQKHTEEELKKYTEESVAAYTEALEAAKKALADRKKTKETIDQAKAALEAADTALAVCACEITSLTVANAKVVMEAGETSGTTQLTPQAAVAGRCQAAGHPEGNEVSYRYEVTNAGTTGATVSEIGLVTVHQAGTATITVTAELASGTEGKRTKTATVTIEVTKPATVTFDANGGSFAGGQSTTESYADANGNVSAPEKNPEKLGYVFTGWKKADGSAFDFETDTVSGDITLKADWAEQKAGVTLNSAKDFSIGSYSNGSSGAGYRILIVKRENNTGEIGENHLLGKANTKPGDNKIALLQFDLSGYTAAQGKTLEKVLLRLCMAGSNGALTDNQLKVFAIPSESGITDLTKSPSEQGITLGDGETLPASWSWDAVKAVLDKWNPGEGSAKEFSAAGLSDKYSRTGTNVNMNIRNQKDAELDKTAYYVDITEAVQNALAAGTKNLILAVNEMKNVEHYFISSVGAKGEGSTEKYDNATEDMAPSLRFYYEEDTPEPEECTCTLGDINIDGTLSLAAGTTKTLSPSTAINYTGCPEHSSAEAGRVTYKYEVTTGSAVTVDPTSGLVTAGSTAGTATVTITAMLDGDTTKTKTKTVEITVTETEPEECTCTLGDINIESTLSLAAGTIKTLSPSTAINYTGCPVHNSAGTNRVTYKYEVTEGSAVIVDPTSGEVAAGDTEGSATVTITAMLDGDAAKTKTAAVVITVMKLEEGEVMVSYYANAGSNDSKVKNMPKNGKVSSGTELSEPRKPSLTGYTFKGWSKTKNGAIVKWPQTITAETEFYAIWEENSSITVEEAKAAIEKAVKEAKDIYEGPDNYSDATWKTFRDAYEAATGDVEDMTAEELQALADDLKTATEGLVVDGKKVTANATNAWSAAQGEITAGNTQYITDTWDEYVKAYNALNQALTGGEDLEPEELIRLERALAAAKLKLTVDQDWVSAKVNLTTALNNARAIYAAGGSKYTAATWKAFTNAYTAAKAKENAILADSTADALNKLAADLNTARTKLAPAQAAVDKNWVNAKNALTAALKTARPIYLAGGSKYTAASWKTFANAYAAANAKANATAANSTAKTLSTLAAALDKARKGLAAVPVLKAGDFVEQSGIRYTVIDAAAKTAGAAGVSKKTLKKVNILPTVVIKGVTCTVTEIQANGFAKFTKVKSVTIGSNVTKIGKKAFYGCKAMTKLTVSGDVKIFDAQSFGGCKKLKSINFKGKKVPAFKSKAFKGTASNMTVKLSKTLKKGKNKKTMTNKLKKAGISKKAKIK